MFNIIEGDVQLVDENGVSLTTVSGANGPMLEVFSNISGNVTMPVSAAALPLPAGAATSTAQTDGSQKTQIVALNTWVTTAVTLTTLNTTYLLPTTEQTARKVLIVYNVSDTAVCIGSSSVTTTNGILLLAGGTMTLDAESGVYAVCSVSGKILNVLEGK